MAAIFDNCEGTVDSAVFVNGAPWSRVVEGHRRESDDKPSPSCLPYKKLGISLEV